MAEAAVAVVVSVGAEMRLSKQFHWHLFVEMEEVAAFEAAPTVVFAAVAVVRVVGTLGRD